MERPPNNNMSISDDLLVEIAIQDIGNANSARTTQTLFNILFDMESMGNFYVIDSSSLSTCYHSKEYKDWNIENNIS